MMNLKIGLRTLLMTSTCFIFAWSSALAEKVLHRGNGAEPATLDPHFASGVWENTIIGDMFMGLTTEAADGKTIAGLAKSWDISADGKVYIFYLRSGIRWSDGQPITADDFEFSLKRILKPETAAKYAFILYPILNAESINKGKKDIETLGVRAVNKNTLEIQLEESTPFFLQQLTHYTSWAVPAHVVQKYGKDWSEPKNMVVSGAFKPVEWVPQSHIKLVKNPLFFDAENVKLDAIYFYPIEDYNVELKRFRAGELHTTSGIPSGQTPKLRQDFSEELRIAIWLGIYYYPVNTQKISDSRVREAMSLAINRKTITDKILKDGSVPAYSFVPRGISNYVPDSQKPSVPFAQNSHRENLMRAKKLMKEAGYSARNPFQIELKYNTNESHKKIAIAISAMWRQIHIRATLFNQEAKVHYDDLRKTSFEVARAGWIGDYNDPTTFLDLFRDNEYNYGRWVNQEYLDLTNEAQGIIDLRKRALKLAEAEQLVLDNSATIPIYYYVSKHLVSQQVVGWKNNIMDTHRSRWIDLK